MAEAAYSIADAVSDLVEVPAAPATYDPGTIDNTPAEYQSQGGLTAEQAADLIDDDADHQAPAGKAVATINGRNLTLPQVLQCLDEAVTLHGVLGDLQARYDDIAQVGRNIHVGATAIAELLNVLFPRPDAALAQTDPLGWQQAQVVYEQVQNAAIQVVQYAHGIAEQNAEWAKAQRPAIDMAYELARFKQAYPKADDPTWAAMYRARVTQVAEHCGFHASELNTVTDHRALKVLDLAATALERRQSGKRDGAKPSSKPSFKPGPRLVADGGSLTMSEAMHVDFD